MPLTFPSHAALVVPLWRAFPSRLWPAPLIAGTVVPDLGYAVGWGGHLAHQWNLFWVFCLPAGLFLWFWAETLFLPALTRSLGEVRGVRPGRVLQTRGLPRTLSGWAWGAFAITLGAASHLLWDGFTHRAQWPAALLYPEVHWVALGREWYLSNLLQYASSLFGLLLMGAVAVRQYPRQPQIMPGRWGRFQVLALAVAVAAAALLFHDRHHFHGMNATGVLWFGFWKAVGAGLVAATVWSAWVMRPRGSGWK